MRNRGEKVIEELVPLAEVRDFVLGGGVRKEDDHNFFTLEIPSPDLNLIRDRYSRQIILTLLALVPMLVELREVFALQEHGLLLDGFLVVVTVQLSFPDVSDDLLQTMELTMFLLRSLLGSFLISSALALLRPLCYLRFLHKEALSGFDVFVWVPRYDDVGVE